MTRLLVVDDEAALLDLMSRRLSRLNYQVRQASCGEEALQILAGEEIDVLITDFQMPGINGCETITRALQISPFLQSIVITGHSEVKTVIDAMVAGAFNYLQKPVNITELHAVIRKALEKRRLLQEVADKRRQLEEYRSQLETLVEKRTHALTAVNEQLKMEIEERKKLEESLRKAKIAAEKANSAKSEFLANMSHEIRTPMTSAIGLLNLVLDTDLAPKQKAYLEMARVSTVVMHNLLNDILDFSKIEVGRLHLESISFDPAKIVASVVDLQRQQAAEKAIRLTSTVDDLVPKVVIGDPNRLRQIILNLVSNAIKFTQYGEVDLRCRPASAENPDPGHQVFLHFSVRDTGIGIDRDKIALIFDAFTQADSSTTRKFGGVGLGLNISAKLVEMMGGRIWVESELGRGSTFHFICRFGWEPERVEAARESEDDCLAESAGEGESSAGTVLVVEDDQMNQWVIREILEHQGYSVVQVADGLAALQAIDAHPFDLVLLDLKLPKIDGYEVVQRIREKEQAEGRETALRLPVVALTGLASEEIKERCLQAGMDDFLSKPFAVDRFIAVLKTHIRGRQRPAFGLSREESTLDVSVLAADVFNEQEALARAGGNWALMLARIGDFLDRFAGLRPMLSVNRAGMSGLTLEQEVHRLKEMALDAGAICLGDELFALLMQVRKNERIDAAGMQLVGLEAEMSRYRRDPRLVALLADRRAAMR